ncbi:NAD-dependent epimerase/dehydratase family protein [Eubacterium limosum]|uniref:NAD-dependent epimerase/dehydratase family protein n=1 Tax=Eubacterium limosum TaxID=1736 RepID=UPI001559F694|nr:NAD-dependent epimerase/dehydratase [Eubacterium limosum]
MLKTIVLTGATGVFGSKLLEGLLNNGYDVICIKRSLSSFKLVKDISDKCTWYSVDDMEKAFKEKKISGVIHTVTTYGKKTEEYFDVYESNLVLPLKLLSFAQKYECQYFINTGTFFDKELVGGWDEKDKVYVDTYVKLKNIFEHIAKDYVKELKPLFINMRLEHVYSSCDERKFVNFIIKSLINNVEVLNLSEGRQERDWIYIGDVVDAYLKVIKKIDQFKVGQYHQLEIGTGVTTSVRDFVKLAKTAVNSNTRLNFGKVAMNKGELEYSKADTKFIKQFGWTPKYDIHKGFEKVVTDIKGEMK